MSQDQMDQQRFYIAGIGASAGGLEALQTLLDHTAPDTGIAYVIVQHLSPNHKSFMAELLSRHTEMELVEIQDNLLVEPNKVYVLPPKHMLSLREGRLHLTELKDPQKVKMPIDLFFQYLAEEKGSRAIGIVLSGTGSDGSRGIEFIKENGGIVIVQQESNAKFDGMPKNAIKTGFVDFVLPAERIGEEIRGIVRADREDFVLAHSPQRMAELSSEISALLLLMKEQLHVDFTQYKISSVLRRIEKRMGVNRIYSIREYLQFINQNPDEILKLKQDLLIGVTAFFRDSHAFEDLAKEVVPLIFDRKKKEKEIRIWTAGCSTGEEAYSLAILFRMHMEQINASYNIKIFATDLDQHAVETASVGIYPESISHSVSPDILQRYFVRKREGYQIHDSIRKMIVFAQHNILQNPPFINLDLITCRNLLIYLQAKAQKKVMSLFHFALNPGGFLFLGSSETVGKSSHLFEPYNRKSNIFQYRESSKFFVSSAIQFDEQALSRLHITRKSSVHHEFSDSPEHFPQIESMILREHVSPIVIIDENNRMIYSNGPVNKIIRFPQGEPTNQILKLVPEDLAVTIRAAIHKVKRDRHEVNYHDIRLDDGNQSTSISLRAKPFNVNGEGGFIILFFEEIGHKVTHYRIEEHDDANNDLIKRIDDLELELQRTKEYLQVTREELETSNEELQSTNEELIAANEELQSSNEELQSLNEELMTVNNEYQEKIEQLTELTDDISNFLISTNIGTIFLDKSLRIRRFTPTITREINLMEVDIGRPLSHISHNFQYGSLITDAQSVLTDSETIEKEIQSTDGKWFQMKVMPYFSMKRQLDGVVLTFSDITDLKRLNEHLQLLSYAIEQSPIGIALFDKVGRVQYVNPKFLSLSGYSQDEVLGKPLIDLYTNERYEIFRGIWEKVKLGESWTGELQNEKKNGDAYWENVTLLPINDEHGDIIHFLRVAEDITQRKYAERILMESELHSAIGQLAAGIAHEIRNPLTALKGFTKLLHNGSHNSEYTRIMDMELDRIHVIVNELLFLAKPRAIEFEEKNLISIIKEVRDLLEPQANMNNIEIVLKLEVDKYTIRCVEHQIKQVFINLVKNAIEAMPKGGKIYIAAEIKDDSILIQIRDEGSGIPEKLLAKIGQPFFTTKEKGTGLGLMVSQKIIEYHDGTLTINSRVNQGTEIQILFM